MDGFVSKILSQNSFVSFTGVIHKSEHFWCSKLPTHNPKSGKRGCLSYGAVGLHSLMFSVVFRCMANLPIHTEYVILARIDQRGG